MQAPKDVYLNNETYAALRAELAQLVALPLAHDPDTEIVRVLGEIGGVWPQSVADDAENAESGIIPENRSPKAA